jgi:signal transduction histidine kinase
MTEQLTATQNLIAHIHNREMESARIARILHDQVGQVLSAVGLQLAVLRMDFAEKAPELGTRTSEIQDMLEQAMSQVREVSYELNPNIVERTGISYALDRLVGRYRQAISASLRINVPAGVHVKGQLANAFYRVADLALDNVSRHAAASQVEVSLRNSPQGSVLEVKDNGAGFDPEVPSSGLGIQLMRHHAYQAGGTFVLQSSPGKGTMVKIWGSENC